MTGRTHDLSALTLLGVIFLWLPNIQMSVATLIVAVMAATIGGLAPDLDQSSNELWHRVPGESLLGKLVAPLLGGHRMISHSIIGLILTGIGLKLLLSAINQVLLVDMNIVWGAFMTGMVSHLIADTFTKEGVPWLFPIPVNIGIPPIKFLRIQTGGKIEKYLVFPGLVFLNAYMYGGNYGKVIDFLRNFVK
jgi:inner membrane protein